MTFQICGWFRELWKQDWFSCLARVWSAEGQGFGQDNTMRCCPVLRLPASRILCIMKEIQVREQGIIALGLWAFIPQGSIYIGSPPLLPPPPPTPCKVSLCQTIFIKEMTRSFWEGNCLFLGHKNESLLCFPRNMFFMKSIQTEWQVGKVQDWKDKNFICWFLA